MLSPSVLALLLAVFFTTEIRCAEKNYTVRSKEVDVTRKCPDVLYRVEETDVFWVEGGVEFNNSQNAWWRNYGGQCKVTFETTQDQGLCVDMYDLDIFSFGVTMDFLTNPFRPEKSYDKFHGSAGHFCTHKNLVTLTMAVQLPPEEDDTQPAFRFAFQIRNSSLDQIQRVIYMDSPVDCNMKFNLRDKESALVKSHRNSTTDPGPKTCKLTFTTDSEEEYGEVCVLVETWEPRTVCDMSILLDDLNADYYGDNVTYDCETKKSSIQEVCSMDQTLTLIFKRGNVTHVHGGVNFVFKVASKKMTFWESEEKKKVEQKFLTAAKSFCVVIATFDTLIALGAAFISISSRYPYGVLKVVGDAFGRDPAIPAHFGNEYPVAVAVTSGESDPPPF